MEAIAITDAKAKLPAIVRAARMGEATVITHQGIPVARVVPYNDNDKENT